MARRGNVLPTKEGNSNADAVVELACPVYTRDVPTRRLKHVMSADSLLAFTDPMLNGGYTFRGKRDRLLLTCLF